MSEPKSTLREELEKENAKVCRLQQVLNEMDDELRPQVEDVLQDPDFSTASIVRALGKRGYKVDRQPINKCRRECDCGFFDLGPGKKGS